MRGATHNNVDLSVASTVDDDWQKSEQRASTVSTATQIDSHIHHLCQVHAATMTKAQLRQFKQMNSRRPRRRSIGKNIQFHSLVLLLYEYVQNVNPPARSEVGTPLTWHRILRSSKGIPYTVRALLFQTLCDRLNKEDEEQPRTLRKVRFCHSVSRHFA